MKPLARKDDLVIQEVGGEILVYDLQTNKAICLNQTSALVWQNCDGTKNALEISQDIEKQLGSAVSEDLVWFAVNQLQKEKLITEEKEIVNKFEGLNRREVIKKIGFDINDCIADCFRNYCSNRGYGSICRTLQLSEWTDCQCN